MAPTPKSSTGSTTTPATSSRAPPTTASVDPTSSTPSPQPASNSGSRSNFDRQRFGQFLTVYNTERPHRAHPHHLLEQAYLARPKATPGNQPSTAIRLRSDIVDHYGKLTLRHGSRLHHLGIGRGHASTPALILVTATTVTVITKTGHHIIASHHIDPDHHYWPNKQKNPAKAGAIRNDDATHV